MIDRARIGVTAATLALLGGCSGISDAIAPPKLTPISNPASLAGATRVSMPLPAPAAEPSAPNSLWRKGARSFFGDQRAANIGPIPTVNIEIADSAQIANTTARSRTSSTSTGVQAALGFEDKLKKALPGTPSLDPGVSFDSDTSSNGTGSVDRKEAVSLTVAAVITDKLPN